jgi:dolichyl-phosphate beta-glucosyltransferase
MYCTRSEPNLSCNESEKYFLDPKTGKRKPFPTLSDDADIDLSIIVPAYNEQERLPTMMDDAMGYLSCRLLQHSRFSYEVIIVDDGSFDRTTEIALDYSKKYGSDVIRVLTLEKNRGKGGAVRMGMLRGRGRRLLFADADGATKFADVEKLEQELDKIEPNAEDGMAVVCGSRAHLEKDSIAQRSLLRTMLMFTFHFLVRFLCVRSIHDTQCGFKLFSRPAAQLLFRNQHVERWAFDVDILHIAQYFGIPVAEVAVNWREIPGSKLSPLWASLQMARDLLMIRLRYLTGVWKMRRHPKQL